MVSFSSYLALSLFAQTESKFIEGKQYVKEDKNWYVVDKKTESKFLLDETSLSVKLKDNFPREALDKVCEALGIKTERENMLGIIDLKLPESSNIFGVYNHLKNSAMFEWIDINSYGTVLTSIDPNDEGYPQQYYLDDGSGYENININEAWDFINDNNVDLSNIVVAVLDEGVDDNHGDLSTNMWTNAQGFHGYDYVLNNNYPEPLVDDHHGTGVAGLIAARTNNTSNGVAGVAGGWDPRPGVKIMSVRVGSGMDVISSIIDDAILYAANNGAKIINMSFIVNESAAIKTALDYAYAQKGILLVAGAGNANPAKGYLEFPARDFRVMGVGGITKAGGAYGNYGPTKEIVAPATHIVTTVNSTVNEPYRYGLFDLLWGQGTSASTPQGSGAAALIWAANPNLLHLDIRKLLRQSATDKGAYDFDEYFGYGLLNVYHAFLYLEDYQAQPEPPSLSISIVSQRARLSWTHGHYVDGFKIYRSYSDNGKFRFQEVADVSGGTTTWTDNSYTAIPYNPLNPPPRIVYYRVTAYYDEAYDVESVFSNEVSVGTNQIDKSGSTDDEVIKYTYQLEQNYPNPFNPATIINFELAEETNVTIKVYDILGRVVTELVNGNLNEGKHKVNFNAANLTNGVYFYTIEAGSFRDTKKMILLK